MRPVENTRTTRDRYIWLSGLPDVLVEVLQKNGQLTAGRNSLIPDVQSQKPQLYVALQNTCSIITVTAVFFQSKAEMGRLGHLDRRSGGVEFEVFRLETVQI